MSALKLHLRANERLFVNGTVLAVDRPTALTLLGRADFLREAHVMQAEDATTPLRRLYFAVQAIVLDPEARREAMDAGARIERLLAAARTPALVAGLLDARRALESGRPFHALKALRPLFAIEAERLGADVEAQWAASEWTASERAGSERAA